MGLFSLLYRYLIDLPCLLIAKLARFYNCQFTNWVSTNRYNGQNCANLALQKGLFYRDDLG
jgi:hypothetical protein